MFQLLTETNKPADKELVVFIAKDVYPTENSSLKYTSDPYCGWICKGAFYRWPHANFKPTHFMVLPKGIEN